MNKKKMNILILINSIGLTIMIFGITISLISFRSITTKKSFPKIFNNAIVKIESDSMLPEFKNNQIVAVSEINPEKINIGDKIAYYKFYENGNVAKIEFHEVSDILLDANYINFFKIKGTANLDFEQGLVHQDSIIGKYNENAKFFTSLLTFSMSTLGIFLLILFPILLLISIQILYFTYLNENGKNYETKIT